MAKLTFDLTLIKRIKGHIRLSGFDMREPPENLEFISPDDDEDILLRIFPKNALNGPPLLEGNDGYAHRYVGEEEGDGYCEFYTYKVIRWESDEEADE